MSRLGARHVRQDFLEFGQKPRYVLFSGIFGLRIDFDDLHFTYSPNAPPLIVRSSYDSNKIKTS
jgi:hypothetical protein